MYDMLALYEAKDVQDAVRLRLEHPEAQIIAGGTDVLVQMREGKRAGKALISIQKCDEMRGVSIDDEENIRIGSLTSFTHITNDPIIQKYINVLGEVKSPIPVQSILPLETISRGIFENTTQFTYNGVNIDIPTYLRQRIDIDKGQ